MKLEHIDLFKKATTEAPFLGNKVACILVRDTNERSLRFVGQAGYIPKPIECKANTASNRSHQLAGLVVNPFLVPTAFSIPVSVTKAKENWRKFERVMRTRSGWEVSQSGRDYGCLKFRGKYLHGDYDLFDIIPVDRKNLLAGNKLKKGQRIGHMASLEKKAGQDSFRGWGVTILQDYVNPKMVSPMLQHGSAMQYADDFEDTVHVFTPDHNYKCYDNVKAEFYSIYFPHRSPLGLG